MAIVLVVAWPDLAERVSKLPIDGMAYIVSVEDAKDLRRKIHSHQPSIIVLDYRIGGSRFLAIDEVPAIVDRTSTKPRVIAILPKTSRTIEGEAAKKGCYDVVTSSGPHFDRDLFAAVETARRYLKARGKSHVPVVSRRKMH